MKFYFLLHAGLPARLAHNDWIAADRETAESLLAEAAERARAENRTGYDSVHWFDQAQIAPLSRLAACRRQVDAAPIYGRAGRMESFRAKPSASGSHSSCSPGLQR
jgi:hypothetical protein